MPMNQEVKAQWVAALRSGAYEQGRSHLRSTEDKFCCLGVLCDVAVEQGLATWQPSMLNPDAFYVAGKGTDRSPALLPVVVQQWAGLCGSPQFTGGGGEYAGCALTSVNDNEQETFSGIADLIEADSGL